MSIKENGFLTIGELEGAGQYPSKERLAKGPMAVVECIQEIPCNPCEEACKFKAIEVGQPITNLPKIHEDKCMGCGVCVAQCPGLAIFIVDKSYSKDYGTVAFPYEYYPLPETDEEAEAVDRRGQVLCSGKVVKVQNPKSFDRTPVITLEVPIEYAERIRGMKRKGVSL